MGLSIASLLQGALGWKGVAAAAAIAFLAGGWSGWEARDLFADRAALARARAEVDRLQALNAANQTLYASDLAERDRALAAAEAAAASERSRRDDLETTLEELRHAPPDDDRTLSPTAQRFFDGLRQP